MDVDIAAAVKETYSPQRGDESGQEYCERLAIDVLYHVRDKGGDMHQAGRAAATAVLDAVQRGQVVEWIAQSLEARRDGTT